VTQMPPYKRGARDGKRWAIRWLHERAKEMNDPHATQVLNAAAFNMGIDAKRTDLVPLDEDVRVITTDVTPPVVAVCPACQSTKWNATTWSCDACGYELPNSSK
jgi:hypothetical protein